MSFIQFGTIFCSWYHFKYLGRVRVYKTIQSSRMYLLYKIHYLGYKTSTWTVNESDSFTCLWQKASDYACALDLCRQGGLRAFMVISESSVALLDKLIKDQFGPTKSLFDNPGYLFSPQTLDEFKIPFNLFVQYPGDLVHFKPMEVYAVVNLGPSISEYLMYLHPSWMPKISQSLDETYP